MIIELDIKDIQDAAYACRELAGEYQKSGVAAKQAGRLDFFNGWNNSCKRFTDLSQKLYQLAKAEQPKEPDEDVGRMEHDDRGDN